MSLWLFLWAIVAIDSKLSWHTVESTSQLFWQNTQSLASISVLVEIFKQNSPDFCNNCHFSGIVISTNLVSLNRARQLGIVMNENKYPETILHIYQSMNFSIWPLDKLKCTKKFHSISNSRRSHVCLLTSKRYAVVASSSNDIFLSISAIFFCQR